METKDELFFRLLRFALGTESTCPKMQLREWLAMFQMAKKQALTGFIGSSLNAISGNVLIETGQKSKDAFEDLIIEWSIEVVKIARRNQKVNKDVVEEFHKLETKGLECCLLKGQGNTLMYPNPESRTSGDIDVWVRFKDSANVDANIRRIIQIVKSEKPDSKATCHHIDALDINGTPVEVHYRPQFLFCRSHDKSLQKFFIDNANGQFVHKVNLNGRTVNAPTAEFNIVFQLSHIYNHLFHEGIGLRQIIDYYYVLKSLTLGSSPEGRGDTIPVEQKEKGQLANGNEIEIQLRKMGLHHIAGSIMWIMVSQLGMDKDWAIAEPDEKRGRFVLREILRGGNFGKYDLRNAKFGNGQLGKNIQRIIRDIRLVRYFPSEALGEPFFRLWHAWWRYKHN